MASSTALSLLQINFPEGPERNRALSVFAAVSSAGFAAGVVLGGALTAAFGWRAVFFINVPIGLVAAFLAPRIVAESKVEGRESTSTFQEPWPSRLVWPSSSTPSPRLRTRASSPLGA